MSNKLSALDAINSKELGSSLINPFDVIGLYPLNRLGTALLPFELPDESLLEALPYLFNTAPALSDDSCYDQIVNNNSYWHHLVDGTIIDLLVIPTQGTEMKILEGPMTISTIQLQQSLSLNLGFYTLLIIKQENTKVERISIDFFGGFLQRVYMCISTSVGFTYLKVIINILSVLPNNELNIKGYTITHSNNLLYVNNQFYDQTNLEILGWLMYLIFN
jgi:hypothetical protein